MSLILDALRRGRSEGVHRSPPEAGDDQADAVFRTLGYHPDQSSRLPAVLAKSLGVALMALLLLSAVWAGRSYILDSRPEVRRARDLDLPVAGSSSVPTGRAAGAADRLSPGDARSGDVLLPVTERDIGPPPATGMDPAMPTSESSQRQASPTPMGSSLQGQDIELIPPEPAPAIADVTTAVPVEPPASDPDSAVEPPAPARTDRTGSEASEDTDVARGDELQVETDLPTGALPVSEDSSAEPSGAELQADPDSGLVGFVPPGPDSSRGPDAARSATALPPVPQVSRSSRDTTERPAGPPRPPAVAGSGGGGAFVDHLSLALSRHRAGDLETAQRHYLAALVRNDLNAEAHNNLGVLYQERDRLSDAVREFERAIAIDARHAKAHNNLGVALLSLGRLGAAVEAFQQALALDSNNVESLVNLAIALSAGRQTDDAERTLRRALEIAPRDPAIHYNLAVLLEQAGESDDALEHYRAFLRHGNGSHPELAANVQRHIDGSFGPSR